MCYDVAWLRGATTARVAMTKWPPTPQQSLQRIIATRFIARNCCHKMVTKVVLRSTRELCLSSRRYYESNLYDGNIHLYEYLIVFGAFLVSLAFFHVIGQ